MSNSSSGLPTIEPGQRVRISLGALVGIVTVTIAGVLAWTVIRLDVSRLADRSERHTADIALLRSTLLDQTGLLQDIKSDVRSLKEADARAAVQTLPHPIRQSP